MLTKLLKHEFRATARIMGPLYLVLLAVALGFNFSARLMDTSNVVLNVLAALVILAYVAAIIGVFIVAFILMLQRFYKNLLGDEGYIMFTLPASVHQHVWSKLIVSAVWFIATGAAVILSVFVAAFNVSFLADLASVFPELFRELNAYYAFNGTAFLLEFLALMLAACMSFSLQFYAALAVGHSFANHKMALSVVFFFVFQFVMQLISGTLLAQGPLQHLLAALNFQVSGMPAIHVAMLLLIALTLIYGAVFYIVTTMTLQKRLNLE